MHYYAGLDIGTTHTKLIICNSSLELVFQSKLGYQKGFGDRLDANEILQHANSLLLQASEELSLAHHQITISLSAAMHSILLVNESAEPITPMYTWADNSSLPLVESWRGNTAVNNLFFDTGTPLHPMSPFCKLAWMRQNSPELLSSAFKCIGIKELVWYHFTQCWEIDHSLASATGFFSLHTLDWNPEALLIAGLTTGKLSLPVPVTRKIDKGNIHWVIGGSDGCLAQLGSGAMTSGAAALTIGTSGAIRILLPRLWVDERKELFTYLLDQENFVCGGATNNGGIVLQWWQQQVMGKSGDVNDLAGDFVSEASSAEPGCDGLVCLPYFGGERAPVWNAAARGQFVGIHNRHGQPEFKRAILEGIGFSFLMLLQKLEQAGGPIQKIYASGGFTHNPLWVKLMADILRKPILVPEEEVDASAMGAIAIGMKAEGIIQNLNEFAGIRPIRQKTYTPDHHAREVYDFNYQLFCRLCQY
ncbi:gluconokinase [Flavihumibacter profundi]|uniref:gluconokinase n=1 Tax=Flavihumibacter profundi TaxID=2716883 RepID=UPI001CC58E4D|nr:gluconokinase [Flavihumibacter profundi]MBZ5856676.1 gluconokinase [Flavihumibacter profundi]